MYITTQQSLSDLIQENLVNGKLAFSAAARLMKIHHTSLIKDGGFNSQKLGQILTSQGFTACGLQNEGFCSKSFWLTLEYFAYESKAKAPGAKQLARTFGQIGVMTAFDKLEVKPKSLNDILLDEVYAEVDRLAFNSTQAFGVKVTIPQYLMELNAKDTHTALTGLWMALTRLKLEEGKSNPIQLHRTIHKQLRQAQIKIEGVGSVHDSLLTGKELKDKTKALEANPSSKQHLLPEIPTLARRRK